MDNYIHDIHIHGNPANLSSKLITYCPNRNGYWIVWPPVFYQWLQLTSSLHSLIPPYLTVVYLLVSESSWDLN